MYTNNVSCTHIMYNNLSCILFDIQVSFMKHITIITDTQVKFCRPMWCSVALLTMSSSLSTQLGSTLWLPDRCREREPLSGNPCWHRGHNHTATLLLSPHTVSPDSSCKMKMYFSGIKNIAFKSWPCPGLFLGRTKIK